MSYYQSNMNSQLHYYRENENNSFIDSQNSQLNRLNATANIGQPTLDNSSSSASTVSSSLDNIGIFNIESQSIHKNSNKKDDQRQFNIFARSFFGISLLSAILIVLFEAYMFAVINIHHDKFAKGKYTENSIYFALFIFAGVFQVLITLIALYSRNLLLLVFLMGFYCCMLIYTGIQYNEVSDKISTVLIGKWKTATYAMNIATICVLAATLVLQSILLYFGLRRYVSWFTFKKIGASLELKRIYTYFQIHRSILMFDFFFFAGFTIQFLVIMVKDRKSVEFILTVIVIPLTIILLFISDISATREFIYGSIFAIVLFLCGIAYVLFKIIRLYTKYTSAYDLAIRPGEYFMGRKSLLTFGIITLVLLVATIVLEVVSICNYGKGLLPSVSMSYKWIPGYNKSGTAQEISISEDEKEEGDKNGVERQTTNNSLYID